MRGLSCYCFVAFFFVAIVVSAISCSGNPVVPSELSDLKNQQTQSTSSSHSLMGYWILAIEPESMSIEAIPLRSSDIHLNVTGILNTTMGVSAAAISGESDPPTGLFSFNITLTHPFPTKPQLAGFDVKGILMTPGTLSVGSYLLADLDETRLENADGYTRWWNPTEFTQSGMFGYTKGKLTATPAAQLTATINPYKLFADILQPDDSLELAAGEPLDSNLGRAVFTAGKTNTRKYRIQFEMNPAPVVKFGYAVDACWTAPSPNPPAAVPDNFPMHANSPEPWRVTMETLVNTLQYDTEFSAGSGVLRLRIRVYDWQGQAYGNLPPQIGTIQVYGPGLFTGPASATSVSYAPSFAEYRVNLTGIALPTAPGTYPIICKVNSNDGTKYKQTSEPAPDEPLSSWQVITIDVVEGTCTTDTDNDFASATSIAQGGAQFSGQVCNPDDIKDYYKFKVPSPFKPVGAVRLCAASSVPSAVPRLEVFDDTFNTIDIIYVIDGVAEFSFDDFASFPGNYYFAVLCPGSDQVAPYFLESTLDLENILPASPVEVTPDDLNIFAYKIFFHENYAYVLGKGAFVYDITNPSAPVLVAHNPEPLIQHFSAFRWPYCYFQKTDALGYHIQLLDFSNPANPVLTENVIDFPDICTHIQMNSSHIFIAENNLGVYSIKIYTYSDPLHPTEVASIPLTFFPVSMGILDPEGPNTWLLVGENSKVHAFSVENTASIVPAAPFATAAGTPYAFATRGKIIYVAFEAAGNDGKLYILYLDTGTLNIYSLAYYDFPGGAVSCALSWPYIYIGARLSGISVCDVGLHYNPVYLGSTPLDGYGHSISIQDNLLGITCLANSFYLFDLSTPPFPDKLFHPPVVTLPVAAEVIDNYILALEYAGSFSALKTIDISDPPNAHVVAETTLTYPYIYLSADNGIAAIAGGNIIMLLNVSDPVHPVITMVNATAEDITSIAVRQNVLFVALDTNFVGIFHIISNGTNIFPESIIVLTVPVRDFSFKQNAMYLCTTSTVETFSIADLSTPTHHGTYIAGANLRETVAQGNYLFMVTVAGIEIADISNPIVPGFVGMLDVPPGGYYSIAVEGQYAYLGGNIVVPVVVDTYPPSTPTSLGKIYSHIPYGSIDLVVNDGYLYECSGLNGNGIHIYDLY